MVGNGLKWFEMVVPLYRSGHLGNTGYDKFGMRDFQLGPAKKSVSQKKSVEKSPFKANIFSNPLGSKTALDTQQQKAYP